MVLRAERLGRRFGRHWVFRGLEFELSQGQCLCVLGANGSGKTTLSKVLAGLVSPSEGKVERPGRNGIGYSAIDQALYPQLSAQEHIDLFARFRGLDPPGPELLEQVGLGDVGDKRVAAFSTGMRARLKLALAIQHQPQVLFLDEPTAALDETGQRLIGDTVEEQLSRGAVVLATNDPADRRYATHEIVLGG